VKPRQDFGARSGLTPIIISFYTRYPMVGELNIA